MRIPSLLPFVALAACTQPEADPRGVDRDETLLTVNATGEAEARPDEARFSLGVETIAGSAREASRINREKMLDVMEALEPFDIPEAQMQTRNLSVGRITYGDNRGRYRAYNILEVRMDDVDRAGDAVTAVTDEGGNLVSGPTLAQSDPEAATKSAYAEAYRNARLRADAYAEAAGLKVNRILTIRDGGQQGGGPYPVDGMAVEMTQQAAPPPPVNAAPFQPGMNRARVNVTVAFALESANE